jgi:peptide deformylase
VDIYKERKPKGLEMAVRSILVVPHEALTTPALEITTIDDRIRTLAEEMAEAMYRAPGIGLAANQVGELCRLIVLDVQYAYADPQEKKKKPIFIINPVIALAEGNCVKEEGCLSVPDFAVEITRAEFVHVTGLDLEGNPITIEADGMLARALQHEVDHLNGTTILERASSLKRNLYRRKLRKMDRRDR